MTKSIGRTGRSLSMGWVTWCLALALTGCASSGLRAPVEDRGSASRTPPPATAPASPVPQTTAPPSAVQVPAPAASAMPGAENAGKPGYYTVRPGDTLMRVGLETGQNWRDIQRWNGLENVNVLEVGQVLRVVPPGVDPTVAAARAVVPPKVESRPLDARGPAPVIDAAASAPAAAPGLGGTPPMVATPPAETAAAASAGAAAEGDEIHWMWPASGTVATGFDEGRSKGLVILGKAGDPVFAAADGRVVYAGSGLRGYGNLVIVKHNQTYLTAYAHNQALLVKEDQPVKRGQKIAEMGSSDAERVQLHFEIRRLGKPIDPARLLPPR